MSYGFRSLALRRRLSTGLPLSKPVKFQKKSLVISQAHEVVQDVSSSATRLSWPQSCGVRSLALRPHFSMSLRFQIYEMDYIEECCDSAFQLCNIGLQLCNLLFSA
jgi:hypothetical protein